VAAVVDVLQTPAFLCRQNEFHRERGVQNKPVNIKKGQFFIALGDAERRGQGALHGQPENHGLRARIFLRLQQSGGGHAFVGGDARYGDARSCSTPPIRCSCGRPGDSSGGQREFRSVLARAAVAAGVAGIFMETHPDPAKRCRTGPNAWPLDRMASLLSTLVQLDLAVKKKPFEESLL